MNQMLMTGGTATAVACFKLKAAICDALYNYVQSKTGIFEEMADRPGLFWAMY